MSGGGEHSDDIHPLEHFARAQIPTFVANVGCHPFVKVRFRAYVRFDLPLRGGNRLTPRTNGPFVGAHDAERKQALGTSQLWLRASGRTPLRVRRQTLMGVGLNVARGSRRSQSAGLPALSTQIISVRADACRNRFASRYSGEPHQALARSIESNWIITKRFGDHVPSRVWRGSPRTKKRPPYFWIEGGTICLYFSYLAGSITSIW